MIHKLTHTFAAIAAMAITFALLNAAATVPAAGTALLA